MNDTIILVSLIVGFFAITIFALGALIWVRSKEQNRQDSKGIDDAVARMDAALDAALVEINKIGSLVKKEIDEKYQAMLFLYDLVDDKKKEIEELDTSEVDATVLAEYLENHVSELKLMQEKMGEMSDLDASDGGLDMLLGRNSEDVDEGLDSAGEEWKRPVFANPKHEKIWDMHQSGKSISEIAKELRMGKGEVKLILNLAGRAG